MASAADILGDESEVLYYLGFISLQVTGYPLRNTFTNKDTYFSHITESLEESNSRFETGSTVTWSSGTFHLSTVPSSLVALGPRMSHLVAIRVPSQL